MPDVRLLLQVDVPAQAAAVDFLQAVPAVVRTERHPSQLVAHVVAPYEGQLGAVLEAVRWTPGLRSLHVH